MIKMQDKQEIILRYYREGHNKSEISRELGISRRIVRKYIGDYERKRNELEESCGIGEGIVELIEDIVEEPKYAVKNRPKRKVTKELEEAVKGYLAENKKRRSSGRHKQQRKKTDIYEELKKEGYDIGYSSICKLVNELEDREKEGFIKQVYDYGEVCEFDWGEVKVTIGGEDKKLQLAVFTSAKGNYRYARLFERQDTFSFQQAHGLFFDHVGGVYGKLVYDNMKVVVKKFVGSTEKEATPGLLSLSMYYLFDFRFCNVRRGNEKGHVEKSVEYVRRKAFSVRDDFESVAEANDHLLEVCEGLNGVPQKGLAGKTAKEVLEEEKEYLMPLPPVMFECGEVRECRVDKLSTVSVETCRYSVPEGYIGKMVLIKIYPDKIVCYGDGEKLCEHRRVYGAHQWSIQIDHYIKNLKRKPGALSGSVALSQTDKKLKTLYERYYEENPKDFIELLDYMKVKQKRVSEIEDAINRLLSSGSMEINTDKIKFLCDRQSKEELPREDNEIENASKAQLMRISTLVNSDVRWEGTIL